VDHTGIRRRGAGDEPRTLGLQGAEALSAALLQDADEIDHVVGLGDRMRHRLGVAQIRLYHVNLAHHP
jgi:hypothetical protein